MHSQDTSGDGILDPGAAENLRAAAALHRAVQESVIDALITINEKGLVESINPAGRVMFGYEEQEVLGKNVSILMPEPYRSEHDGYLNSYLTTGEKRIIGIGREVIALRKDGSTFPVDLSVSEVQLGDRRLFAGLIRDITQRKQAEEALRELSRKIIAIQEEERNRIAQEIHDQLGQSLIALKFQIRNLAGHGDGSPELTRDCSRIEAYINEIARQARDLARSLGPVALMKLGLRRAIEDLVAGTKSLQNMQVSFDLVALEDFFEENWDINAYRIVQESLFNASRHSGARSISVRARREASRLVIIVADDGIGIDAAEEKRRAMGRSDGLGLLIMQERARSLGGSLSIESNDSGTEVILEVVR